MDYDRKENTEQYRSSIKAQFESAYAVARKARSRKLDPHDDVEIIPAQDVAARVEGIVGPRGVAEGIRAHTGKTPDMVAYEVAKEILDGKYVPAGVKAEQEKLIEQSIRTAVAILTEGVLVAPTEGITRVKVRQNPDGSNYLAMYFSGPIRSAGGTVAAISVVIGDLARRKFNISGFRPTDSEMERFVEEVHLYDARAIRLQYLPTADEVRTIVRNCPIMITGDPTEKRLEVSVNKGLERMETDRVRGGMCLVISEMCQKSSKVLKFTKKIGMDWSWMESIVKIGKKDAKTAARAEEIYLDDVAAGRPILCYPGRKGGFRLRYGRTRTTGIAGKAIHPATMLLADEFIAIGTQMRIERPGKGCVAAACDSIDGPVVKLADGSVRKISTYEDALAVKGEVRTILALGDILIAYGDFYKANHPLLPSAWCEEWWALELEKAGGPKREPFAKISADEAFKLSEKHKAPLHPDYTYRWHDITSEQLRSLADWLSHGQLKYDFFTLKELRIESSPAKGVLEELCLPHGIDGGNIILDSDNALALLRSLGMLKGRALSLEDFNAHFDPALPPLEIINKLAGVEVRAFAPTYIGARMGRPEKAKHRDMRPAIHSLFPIGESGGNTRNISKAVRSESTRKPSVEIARANCPQCKELTGYLLCPKCGTETQAQRICPKCGRTGHDETCQCGTNTAKFDERPVDLKFLYDSATKACDFIPDELKGVKGLMSSAKIPERMEKGILRAKNNVSVYKDGTMRFDATNMVLTHFTPAEVGVPVERLLTLGYTHDYLGKKLESDTQLLELKAQDLLLNEDGGDYMARAAQFCDDLLVHLYGLEPYYKVSNRDDMVGQLVVGLSPHTSCGILSRIVGFTKARVGYAHPYLACARRRNCDGDEDSCMLLLDSLLNFSRSFLPESRGGTMDAPIVLTLLLDPKEVDDEVHAMEVCSSFPLAFYEAAQAGKMPGEVDLDQVSKRLGKPEQFYNLNFTHPASSIHEAPLRSSYVTIGSMAEKVEAQFNLCDKIRAVDQADAARRVILTHFLPDLYGNLYRFSRQEFRCLDCGTKFRRVPLMGRCNREGCGGKLLLTITKGGIEKYLKLAQYLVDRYHLPKYLSQRLMLLEHSISAVFRPEEEKEKQFDLAAFM